MAKTSRKLLLACLTIAVCLALIVAGTYALFSAEFSVENHLSAGNLSATLTRKHLESITLDEHGHLTKTTSDVVKDFSSATNKNMFDEGDVLIAPGSKFTADLVLENTGTVAFKYWIEVKLKLDADATAPALASQLQVSVTAGTKTEKQTLDKGLEIGAESGIAVVEIGAREEFSVVVEFIDLEDENNAAQAQNVKFDIIVHAEQDNSIH